MEITPVHTVNLRTILSDSRRIVRANYSHFFALSLFLLPLSLSLVITPPLYHHISSNSFTVDLSDKLLPNHHKAVIFHLLYILILYILGLCAIGTISYSTYNVFIGNPVNYFDALKSLTFSFFPLVWTTVLAQTILFLISLTFLLFVGVIVMLAKSLGFVIDYNSIYFMWVSIVVVATLIVILTYYHMNCSLASMVVVAESKWGFAALIRSWYLVKGMRSVSLSLMLYFGIGNGLLAWFASKVVNDDALRGDTQSVFLFIMLGSFFLMMCLLASIAANAVLYIYCKAFHGKLPPEIAVGVDYITLPADDEKVPCVVTVVQV